jgi:hypothetical protein
MNKFMSFIRDSAWTWGGAVIVLVTLSGKTQTLGLWITGAAFLGHATAFMLSGDE